MREIVRIRKGTAAMARSHATTDPRKKSARLRAEGRVYVNNDINTIVFLIKICVRLDIMRRARRPHASAVTGVVRDRRGSSSRRRSVGHFRTNRGRGMGPK